MIKSTTARSAIPTTDGLHLSAMVEGNAAGPTLILVHGYPDNLQIWNAVVEQLKGRYRIVRYDVRGAGRSDAPNTLGGYRLTQLSADFRRVIDHYSPDAPVHLVGHDWGSIQGWEFATDLALADRIASFTSISGPCLDHVTHIARNRRLGPQVLRDLAASWPIFAFHLPALGPLTWKLGLARHWHRVLARIERLPTLAAQGSQQRDGVNGINLYRANVAPRLLRPRQRHATAPVLLIAALRDPFVKPYMLQGLERLASQLKRVEINAAHWSPLTHADELAGLIAVHVSATTKEAKS